jgi:hypothetical protein
MGFQFHNNIKPRSTDAEWYTPGKVFDAMGVEFDLDPASPGAEIVPWIPAKRHLTKAENGLVTPWEGFVWLTSLWAAQRNASVAR